MGERKPAGSVSFAGGQNAGLLPDRIGNDQFAKGINVTTKNGGLGPRPGFVHTQFEMVTTGGFEVRPGVYKDYMDIFVGGKFQGATPYITTSGVFIIVVVSGIIFKLDPRRREIAVLPVELETAATDRLEPTTQRLSQYTRRVNFSQAGTFLVIFDYPDRPVIVDGDTAYRSPVDAVDAAGNPAYYIPVSSLGAYNNNRLFIADDTNSFVGGDPVGSATAPDAPITFNEVFATAAPYLGQVFSLGSINKNNPITAMGFLQLADTSTGIGPLFVATSNSIFTYRTDVPRSQWESVNFGNLLLYNAGVAGPRAFANLNSDIFFMSGDGRIRSLNVSRNDQGKWANNPLDREVENWTSANDSSLLRHTIVDTFNNRVFVTVNPFRAKATDLYNKPTRDYAFKGLVVLELDNVSGLLRNANPAWAGLWEGIYPMDMVNIENEFFIFAKDSASINSIYSLREDYTYDVHQDINKDITCRVYTKEYDFESPMTDKEERSIEIGIKNLAGDATIRVDRKTESAPNFTHWRTWQHEAPVINCNVPSGCLDNLLPHSFRELNFGSPESDPGCNPATQEDLRYFRKSQYRITITARNWLLESFLTLAEVQGSDMSETICSTVSGAKILKDCTDQSDWLIHRTPFDTVMET